jgi:CBS domain-containing protein
MHSEYQFLKQTKPFCDLPEDIIRKIASSLSLQHFKQKEIMFHQGRSNFRHVLIVENGSLELYYDIDGQKKLSGFLRRGDVCGGIALLKNRGAAIRSIVAVGDASCYRLSGETFLELCKNFDEFQNFFEKIYKRLMRDESYVSIITKGQTYQFIANLPPFSFLPQDINQVFNQSVEKFYRPNPVTCDVDSRIQDAARLMRRKKCSSVLIRDEDHHYVGIVTNNDLINKVVTVGRDAKTAVGDIMSRPLKTVSSEIRVFEALMTMMNANIKHLGVTDRKQNVVGVVTNQDLLSAQGQSPFFLIREIQKAESFAALKGIHHRLPNIIQTIIHSGAKSRNINRMITTISDAILRKIITFAIKELGPPPVDFVFMILGSEGRKEQTLKTDQDNAIIYEDVPKTDQRRIARYFLNLGARICDWLNAAGYAYCVGGIMAKNERWCQPISMWKQDFSHWIHAASGEALLQASIFFDFRGAYGNLDMIVDLRNFLFSALAGWAGFFRHMTENALCFKPPLGFFRKFVVESKGKHRNKFDIKHAMQPVVDFARIFALKHQIAATNTQVRLEQLREKGVINMAEYEELDQAYSFLMQQRFLNQISDILIEKVSPSNYINPKSLSSLEQTLLKAIFKKIEKFQSKLEFEFTGLP